MGKIRRWRWSLLALAFVVFLLTGIRAFVAPEIVVGLNRPIQFDDFAFTILGSSERTLGEGEKAKKYLVLSLKVNNDAKRVTYKFRPSNLMLLVGDRKVGYSRTGQDALDRARGAPDPLAAPLPAGSSATTEVVFEIPESAANVRARISAGPLGDTLEDIIAGKKRMAVR